MKFSKVDYASPQTYEEEMLSEGFLCLSGMTDNENYGGVPGEDETIF